MAYRGWCRGKGGNNTYSWCQIYDHRTRRGTSRSHGSSCVFSSRIPLKSGSYRSGIQPPSYERCSHHDARTCDAPSQPELGEMMLYTKCQNNRIGSDLHFKVYHP